MFSLAGLRFLLFHFYATATAVALTSSATDILNPTESITDGKIIVSTGSDFALGFFSPGTSSLRYVGIWYKKIPEFTVVWVANRDDPINDSSGVLSLALDGNLVISSGGHQRRPLWSTNVSIRSNTTRLKLLNSGNLVLYEVNGNGNNVLWQSFDHPTDVWLPGIKLGLDRRTGLNRVLTSWRSRNDPGRGIYSYGMDPRGSPQFFLTKASAPFWRAGPWNGRTFSGTPEMTPNYVFSYDFVNTADELYFVLHLYNSSIFSTFLLDASGKLEGRTWVEITRQWNTFFSVPNDWCDNYEHCGGYGSCDMDNPVECSCLPGFQPKSTSDWFLRDWSGGCVRKRDLGCGKGDGFLKLLDMKIPDTSMSLVDMNLNLQECKQECLKNCSCTGYAPALMTGGGGGCVVWFGTLMDIRYFNGGGGQDFYLRVDAVELAAHKKAEKRLLDNKRRVVILTTSLVVVLLLFAACVYCLQKKRKERWRQNQLHNNSWIDFTASLSCRRNSPERNEFEDNGTNPELPFIEFDVVAAATDNFSPNNKLGQGGFGAVYKGRLLNGKEIAVKRLSKNSGQGMEEFKNEVKLIAKLQHRNLVRLLACCVHEEEKILIYEYLPNKSLDSFIFDESKKGLLHWKRRFEIIIGIARGILYLHQDSRLRIIHRDLKASNVLLDEEMNPKISDFGMARIFGGDQVQANTTKVVGTYGYISPEYAMQGLFSIKSDIFSFGVLLLEIISGKKNSVYFQDDPSMNLIEHIWDLWKADRALEIVDSSISDLYSTQEVLRCIQVGLLCVQGSASDRPTISNVIFMLGSETQVPTSNQPALILKKTLRSLDSSIIEVGSCSINEVTITTIDPR